MELYHAIGTLWTVISCASLSCRAVPVYSIFFSTLHMKSLFISIRGVRDHVALHWKCASAFVIYAVGPTLLVQMSQRIWIRHPILKTSTHARRREVLQNRRQNSIAFFLIFHFVWNLIYFWQMHLIKIFLVQMWN